MKLTVFKETDVRIPRAKVQRLFDLVMRGEGLRRHPSEVNLVLAGNSRLRRLNRKFRSRDKATDVLSFNIDPPEQTDGMFGEVYLSVEYAQKQATEAGCPLWSELLLLTCHGLLHLCGYDHVTELEEKKMFALQNKYLGRLNRGD